MPKWFKDVGVRFLGDGSVEVECSKGVYARIDRADLWDVLQHNWHASECTKRRDTYYVRTQMNGRKKGLHRFLTGDQPGMVVDHVNGDTLDNRRANLRVTTQRVNNHNHRVPSFGLWRRKSGHWVAQLSENNQNVTTAACRHQRVAKRLHLNRLRSIRGEHQAARWAATYMPQLAGSI